MVDNGLRIVVADDSDDLRGCIKNLFSEFNQFKIVGEAANGEESLNLVALHQPDVVLLDIHMPKKNGFEVLASIKSSNPEIMVIMMSNYGNINYKNTSYDLGCSYFFDKNEDIQELINQLEQLREDQKPHSIILPISSN